MSLKALLIPIGEDWFALPMEHVREIVPDPSITPVPTAPESVLGVFNLRGEIVPVLDTGSLLGMTSVSAAPFAAVVDTPVGVGALALSRVPEAADLEDAVAPSETPGTVAAYSIGRRVAVLIDINTLFAPARIGGWVE